MPNFKSTVNVHGGWINGRWHPNGSIAAQTGTAPPDEQTIPAKEPAKVVEATVKEVAKVKGKTNG